jgi:SAM-dependent methyltransferase
MDERNPGGRPDLRDPLAGTAWSRPDMVAGFAASPPNADMLQFAARELHRARARIALDIGCGAGRNAIPLAAQGWTVIGTDLSAAMLSAARQRAAAPDVRARVATVLAPMQGLPLRDRSCELIVAHGIWNLARTDDEFRAAVREAARVAAPGAGLFVFTFSRHTIEPGARPVDGETYVFTQFSGEPQCFLTDQQLLGELREVGFMRDPTVPLRELNRRPVGMPIAGGPPVIYQAAFRYRS